MTLLLCFYVAIMIALSNRIRKGRRADHRQLQQERELEKPAMKNGEKCLIIDVVA